MKRMLVTSTDVMMIQFLVPHILRFCEKGYAVDIACSNANGYEEEGYIKRIKERIPDNSEVYVVKATRNPFKKENYIAYQELKRIINKKEYDVIWTNEPVMGVLTRAAAYKARKKGTKVLYMAHGFHFFKGAPVINWVYYPVEKIMAFFCDGIITINKEDYAFSKKHLKTQTYHIDGIGVDLQRFLLCDIERNAKRKELGIDADTIVLVSVGELLPRKNHQIIIEQLVKFKDMNIKYVICGTGELEALYKKIAESSAIQDKLLLLGHRYDIPEILAASDIFVHPSSREGFGIAIVEAMASGLPLITSNIGGINDFVVDKENGYKCSPRDGAAFSRAINELVCDSYMREKFGQYNKEKAINYGIENSFSEIENIIEGII